MGLIPQVKCGRCDRSYSGLRSRCPYCGAHRHKKGKRVTDSDNATWKLIIGVLLIVVLIAAVIVILVTGSNESEEEPDKNVVPPSSSQDGVETKPGENVQKTHITVSASDGTTVEDLDLLIGGTVELTATVTSEEENTNAPVWTSSNESVATVAALDETGLKYSVTGVAAGTAVVTVTAGDAKYEINITCGETPPSDPTTPAVPQTVVASAVKAKSRYADPVQDFTLKIAETQEVTAVVTPSNVTSVPTWTSSDESVVAIVATDETGMKARCTGVSRGTATITVTVDAVSYDFTVRCDGKTL